MHLKFISTPMFIFSLGILLSCTPLYASQTVFSTAEDMIEVTPAPESTEADSEPVFTESSAEDPDYPQARPQDDAGDTVSTCESIQEVVSSAEEPENYSENPEIWANSAAESLTEVTECGETQDKAINYLDRLVITVSAKDNHGNDLSKELKNEKLGLSLSHNNGFFGSDEYTVYIDFDGSIRDAEAITAPGNYSIRLLPGETTLSEDFLQKYVLIEKETNPSSVQFSQEMDKVEISVTCVFMYISYEPDPSGCAPVDYRDPNFARPTPTYMPEPSGSATWEYRDPGNQDSRPKPRPTGPTGKTEDNEKNASADSRQTKVSFSQTKQQTALPAKEKKFLKKLLGLGTASATCGTISSIIAKIIIFVLSF